MKKNNHIDSDGNVQMVDINEKDITHRKAIASGYISLSKEALESIKGGNKKGDVLTVAQIAGIQAAKNTSMLIPLAHQLNIISINMFFKLDLHNSLLKNKVVPIDIVQINKLTK